MSNASFVRTNFLGGEWSLEAQGRMDRDEYLTAMNLCYNGLPVDTGAWVRRSGTYNVGPTRRGARVAIYELHFNQQNSYIMEFDNAGHLRFATDGNPVLEAGKTISAASTANPSVITSTAHGYTTGDSVIIYFDSATAPNPDVALLTGRMYRITVLTADTFSLQDEVTNANVSGAALSGSVASLRVARVLDFATPYTSNYANIRTVQDQNICLVLNPTEQPYSVDMDWDGSNITFQAATFEDGPYLDAVTDTVALNVSGTTGTITIDATLYDLTTPANIFSATDVGRMMRILDRPDAWTTVASYVVGNTVSYGGAYYVALTASTNVPPPTDLTAWAVLARAESWTWGTIASYVDANTVTFTIRGPDLAHALPKYVYRMGLYSDTTGWPSVGAFHQGRFWLSGVQPNRVDASAPAVTNSSTISFAPTNQYGQVADNNGIALALKATDVAGVTWMMPSDRGLIVGTRGGEWLIQASTLNDPITPTNRVANRVTKYKCARVPAIEAPLATIFVQSTGRGVIEYVPDGTEGGKFGGRDLAHDAKHLTDQGIQKLAYQQEPTPIIWLKDALGALRSISYLRESPWASQAPTWSGWAQHAYAVEQGRTTLDIVSGPSPDGTADAITVVTRHEAAALPETSHRIEVFNRLFEEGEPVTAARFLDHSRTPTLAEVVLTGSSITSVILHGLWYLEGTTVTAFFGGVNAGEFIVSSGQIEVPVADDSLINEAFLQDFITTGTTTSAAGYGSSLVLGPGISGSAAPVTMTEMTQFMGVGNANQAASEFAVADWNRNRLVWWNRGDASLSVSSLVDGSYIMDAGALINNASQAITFDADHFYVGFQTSGIPHGGVNKYSLDDFSLLGTVSGFGSVTDVPANMGATVASSNGGDIVLTCGVGSVTGSTMHVRAHNMTLGTSLGIVHSPGASGNKGTVRFSCGLRSAGFLYGLNGPFGSRGFGDNMYLYKYTCAGAGLPSVATLASWTPNDIDPGATSWGGSWGGPVIDETDGHLLIILNTNLSYSMLKINSTTGAIIWKLAIDGVRWDGSSLGLSCNHQNNRVRHSQHVMLSGRTSGNSCTRNVINTSAGTKTSSTYAGVFPRDEFYNDDTGHHISYCEYVPDGAGIAPDPINYTSLTGWGPPASTQGRWGFVGPVQPPGSNYVIPIVAGYTYISKGQVTRPILPGETGAKNGPRFGKTARIHQAALMLNKSQDVQWGTSFNELQQINFVVNSVALDDNVLFSGTWQDTINDNYNIDASQLCWQSEGPYPLTVLAIGGFIQTNDR